MNFCYIPVASDLHDPKVLNALLAKYEPQFNDIGGAPCGPEPFAKRDTICYFIVTGGTEEKALDLVSKAEDPDSPVFLLAHPSQNSLPASLEILAKLHQDGKKGKIIYLDPEDPGAWKNELSDAVKQAETAKYLRGKTIGVIGDPSDWLVASSPDTVTTETAFGVRLKRISMDTLRDHLESINDAEVQSMIQEDKIEEKSVREPMSEDFSDAVRVYLGMKKLVAAEKIDAVTLRCFDLVIGEKTTGCYALAKLNDEGIVAGCEGDIVTALTMEWLKELTGKLPWMANPSRIFRKSNTLVLAHCTVPFSLVSSFTFRSHFESGVGVGIQGKVKAEEVTLVRIGGKNLDRIWAAEGRVASTGNAADLCRTQIHVQFDDFPKDLLSDPLGNHITVIEGRFKETILSWWNDYR
ncbi:MAG: fucose isomerase [Spirochaetia bacterium]